MVKIERSPIAPASLAIEKATALQRTMTVLYRNLDAYRAEPTVKTLRALRGMLDRSYKFSGFTRTFVQQHIDEYPDLAQVVAI